MGTLSKTSSRQKLLQLVLSLAGVGPGVVTHNQLALDLLHLAADLMQLSLSISTIVAPPVIWGAWCCPLLKDLLPGLPVQHIDVAHEL